MTLEEFSNEFDTLVNSYSRIKDFDRRELLDSIEFNEYEKSLFLTKAQETLVLSLYNGKNPFGDSFEQTEEMRRHLSSLVKEATLTPLTSPADGVTYIGMEPDSKFYRLPDDLWFITFEALTAHNEKCDKDVWIDVIPAKQDEWHRLRKNPFRGMNARRALRLDLSGNVVEVNSTYADAVYYYIRYIRKLNPIVLVKLPSDVSIDGKGMEDTPYACELHEGLHKQILELAVMLALQSKGIGIPKEKEEKRE